MFIFFTLTLKTNKKQLPSITLHMLHTICGTLQITEMKTSILFIITWNNLKTNLHLSHYRILITYRIKLVFPLQKLKHREEKLNKKKGQFHTSCQWLQSQVPDNLRQVIGTQVPLILPGALCPINKGSAIIHTFIIRVLN